MLQIKINSQLKSSPYVIDLKKIFEEQQSQDAKESAKKWQERFIFFRLKFKKGLIYLVGSYFSATIVIVWNKLHRLRKALGKFPRGFVLLFVFFKKNKQLFVKTISNKQQEDPKNFFKKLNNILYIIGEAVAHIPILFYLPFKLFFKSWLKAGDLSYQNLKSAKKLKPAPFYFWAKEAGIFLFICLFLILSITSILLYQNFEQDKGKVLGATVKALSSAKFAVSDLMQANFNQAEENFQTTSLNFSAAQDNVNRAGIFLKIITTVIPQGRTAEDLIDIGANLSQSSVLITQGLKAIQTENNNGTITLKIKILKDQLQLAYPYLESANDLLEKINPGNVPKEYREQFVKLQIILPQTELQVAKTLKLFDNLLILLGHNSWQRYLFLLQNNNEIRPSGGFIGAIAVLDVEQGKVKNFTLPGGGAYDYRAGFSEKVLSPEPLSVVNPVWEMQDCNWFADFSVSAEKCQWFLEKSGGPSVDGVIAMNSNFIVDLLKVLGPIEHDSLIITSENFVELTQNIVESEEAKKSGKPKMFLAELAPLIFEKLFNFVETGRDFVGTGRDLSLRRGLSLQKIINIAQCFESALAKKNIQIYLKDKKLENWLKTVSWAGEIKKTPLDYLLVNIANIGGGKSDILVRQKITQELDIQDDGSAISSVTIRREHLGRVLSKEEQNILSPYERLVNSRNIAYIRVYAPKGSQLLSASGGFYLPIKAAFKESPIDYKLDEDLKQTEKYLGTDFSSGTIITEEFDKTVFANYVWLEPGEFRAITFKYKLPFRLFNNQQNNFTSPQPNVNENNQNLSTYSLLIQKQAGSKNQEFVSKIKLPLNYQIIAQEATLANNLTIIGNSLEYKSRLDKGDDFFGIILDNK